MSVDLSAQKKAYCWTNNITKIFNVVGLKVQRYCVQFSRAATNVSVCYEKLFKSFDCIALWNWLSLFTVLS